MESMTFCEESVIGGAAKLLLAIMILPCNRIHLLLWI